ncbi:SMC-Scp complex subunit ScpB [Candidatus Woesearchaeota archaeon]|nr:SMC-Scp complex subunit ScpB [Candidatus Woesearchaeota archaeon]
MAENDLIKKVEALLFSSGRKMDPEEISALVGVGSVGAIKEVLLKLKKEYDDRASPLMVIEEGESWKLTVREPYLPLVRKINPYTEFPKSVMETLAVIAWKQPILQSTVIKIRTNKAYDHIATLMEMGFVIKERYGRTHMLKLTQKFFDYFDLQDQKSIKDLFKRFKDEIRLDQKRMDEFEKPDNAKDKSKKDQSPCIPEDESTDVSRGVSTHMSADVSYDATADLSEDASAGTETAGTQTAGTQTAGTQTEGTEDASADVSEQPEKENMPDIDEAIKEEIAAEEEISDANLDKGEDKVIEDIADAEDSNDSLEEDDILKELGKVKRDKK